jgi:sulfate adenylyltransferase subunit 2
VSNALELRAKDLRRRVVSDFPPIFRFSACGFVNTLDDLEHRSVFVIREARAKFRKLGMLWSVGKDSTVLLWLVRKAFFGHVPCPLVHVDTTKKIKEMIAFRDRLVREWGLELVVSTNLEALAAGMDPEKGRIACCASLKKDALRAVVAEHGFDGLLLGIRRDEEGTRSKERYFSPRTASFEWAYSEQPPELWDHFSVPRAPGTHVRVHPLLHWTELDIWRYIEREKIPVVDLYFAKDGRRYRSLGCAPCTEPIASSATTVPEIVAELARTRVAERAGRAQDRAAEDAFEQLRVAGYM